MSLSVAQNGVKVTARQAEKKTAEGDNMTQGTRKELRGSSTARETAIW